jgi:hypothetical protein
MAVTRIVILPFWFLCEVSYMEVLRTGRCVTCFTIPPSWIETSRQCLALNFEPHLHTLQDLGGCDQKNRLHFHPTALFASHRELLNLGAQEIRSVETLAVIANQLKMVYPTNSFVVFV